MIYLLLRGKQPTDRDPSETIFNRIDEVDDMWTQLLYSMLGENDEGYVAYWGGNRSHKLAENLTEIRVHDFKSIEFPFTPNVILCRGGFSEYHKVLKRYPNAFKIYYGAGKRYLPQKGFTDYQLILQDSFEQLRKCKALYPDIPVSLFVKPAADNIMYPYDNARKKVYDVCFPANGSQYKIKGHEFVYNSNIPYSILNLGNDSPCTKPTNVVSHRVLRKDIAKEYAKCKCGIVCTSSAVDSCPRVIPEMLACDLPIIVLEGVRFWCDKYINEKTGIIASKDNFWNAVDYVLNNLDKFKPREYYLDQLSLKKSAFEINNTINAVKDGERNFR